MFNLKQYLHSKTGNWFSFHNIYRFPNSAKFCTFFQVRGDFTGKKFKRYKEEKRDREREREIETEKKNKIKRKSTDSDCIVWNRKLFSTGFKSDFNFNGKTKMPRVITDILWFLILCFVLFLLFVVQHFWFLLLFFLCFLLHYFKGTLV